MTIHAYTELHSDFPAYVNLAEQPDGTIKLTVRGRGNGGKDYGAIILTELQAEELADSIYKHNYKGEGEIDATPAAPIDVTASVDLQSIEQYRIQMAGISTAALGYRTEAEGIHPDYDTVAIRDVAKLYAKYEALHKAAAAPATPSGWDADQIIAAADAANVMIVYVEAILEVLRHMPLAAPQASQPEAAPSDEVPYLIVFDDQERKPEMAIGRQRADIRFEQISASWNAHLYVKIASNSRDCHYQNATISASAPVVAEGEALTFEQWEAQYMRGKPYWSTARVEICRDAWNAAINTAQAKQPDLEALREKILALPVNEVGAEHADYCATAYETGFDDGLKAAANLVAASLKGTT